MKTRSTCFKLVLFFVCALAVGMGSLFGQQMGLPLEVEVNFQAQMKTSINIDVDCYYVGDYYEANLGNGTSDACDMGLGPGWWTRFSKGTAKLRPGKKYMLYIDGDDYVEDYRVNFDPVDGYRIYIDGIHRYRVSGNAGDSWLSESYEVYLLPNESAGQFGEGESIQSGSKIFWRAALGTLRDGNSAGHLQIRQSDFSSTLFTPSALDYENSSDEVDIIRSGGVLRQIKVSKGLVDIVVTSTGNSYEIRFYHDSQVQAFNGTLYPVSGTPQVKYKIEKYLGSSSKLQIIKTVVKNDSDTSTKVWKTRLEKSGSTWTLFDWAENGAYLRKKLWIVDGSGNQTIEVRSIAGTLLTRNREVYQNGELGSEVYGYGYQNLTTSYDYHATGKIKSMTRPDGSWIKYDYHASSNSAKMVYRIYEPYKDSPSLASSASPTSGKVTTHSYTTDWTGLSTLPWIVETKVNNVTTSKTKFTYSYPAPISAQGHSLQLMEVKRRDYTDSSNYLETITKSFRDDTAEQDTFFPGKVHSVTNPDGTRVSHAYFHGDSGLGYHFGILLVGWGSLRVEHVYTGTTDSSSGGTLLSNVTGTSGHDYDIDDLYLVPGVSTKSEIVRSATGELIWTKEYVYTSSGWQYLNGKILSYDKVGRMVSSTDVYKANSTTGVRYFPAATMTYEYGLKVSEKSMIGAVTDYTDHDAMGRVTKQIQRGYGSILDIETHFEYDAEGRVIKTKLGPSGAGQIISRSEYDYAGRITKEVAPGHDGSSQIEIDVDYTYLLNGRSVKKTFPDGGVIEEQMYRDGRLKNVTGSATTPKYVDYSVDSNGIETETTALNSSYTHGKSVKRIDWLGRPHSEEAPTYDGGIAKLSYYYDSTTGQLVKKTHDDGGSTKLSADSLYEYDSMGKLVMEGLDINANGTLEETSNDRITEHASDIELMGGAYHRHLKSETYPLDGNGSHTIVLKESWEKLTDFDYVAKEMAESIASDANGNVVSSSTTYDSTLRQITVTTNYSGATNDSVAKSINGLAIYGKSKEGVETSYEYDVYGRRTKVSGRDNVYTEYHYHPGTTQVEYTNNKNFDTGRYFYDASGRVSLSEIEDQDQVVHQTRSTYNPRGQLVRHWGNAAQPVEHNYNSYGWKTSMRTYRGGAGWHDVTGNWPGGSETPDTTVWSYQDSTGLLLSKTDPAGESTSLTYNDRGQVKVRTLARGVTATYSYYDSSDPSSVSKGTGALKKIDYSDGTPDVTYTYFRHGGVNTITDAAGTREFQYRSSDLQPSREVLPYGFYGGNSASDSAAVTRLYSTSGSVIGRYYGIQFGRENDSDQHLQTTYDFSSTSGRVSSATGHGKTFSYTYKNGSNLVSNVSSGNYSRATAWQDWRNVIDSVENKWGSSSEARYRYERDSFGRILTEKTDGKLATNSSTSSDAGFAQSYGAFKDWEYTLKGEVDSSGSFALTSGGGAGSALTGRQEDYTYDNAQNRKTHDLLGESFTFSANNLNQYSFMSDGKIGTTYDDDGNLVSHGEWNYTYDAENRMTSATNNWSWAEYEYEYDYMGRMISRKAPKLVNGLHGQYWDTRYYQNFKLSRTDATLNFDWGGGSPDPSMGSDDFNVRWVGYLEAPKDGNYILKTESDDGVQMWVNGKLVINNWTDHGTTADTANVYLKQGVKVPIMITYYENSSGAVLRLKWSCSSAGIAEQVVPSASLWSESLLAGDVEERRFVYDGWNIIAELDGSKALKETHVWGLDVSGTAQGAGGIAGLLMTREGASDCYPMYDGRGNVAGMLDSTGKIVAGYDYNGFGELVAAVGSRKEEHAFGFSTKYTERAIGIVNFGKRFYDPHNGRFINRDPIGERGGLNLYAMLGNNPVNHYEYLGMGFFSKLFKSIKKLGGALLQNSIDIVRGQPGKAHDRLERFDNRHLGGYGRVLGQIMLGFVPVVGPWLSAAYGAYSGYSSGGVYGAVVGAVGGYAGARAISSAPNAVQAIAIRLFIGEAISIAVRAVDRRIRGFAKWFGRGLGALTLNSGLGGFGRAFVAQARLLKQALRVSPQLSSSGGFSAGGTVTLGPLVFVGYESRGYSDIVSGWVKDINRAIAAVRMPVFSESFHAPAAPELPADTFTTYSRNRAAMNVAYARQGMDQAGWTALAISSPFIGGGGAIVGRALYASRGVMLWRSQVLARQGSYLAFRANRAWTISKLETIANGGYGLGTTYARVTGGVGLINGLFSKGGEPPAFSGDIHAIPFDTGNAIGYSVINWVDRTTN